MDYEKKYNEALERAKDYFKANPIAIFSDNLINACVEMIEKLHRLKML